MSTKLKTLIALIGTICALSGLSSTEYTANVSELFASTEYSVDQKEAALDVAISQLNHQLECIRNGTDIFEGTPNQHNCN